MRSLWMLRRYCALGMVWGAAVIFGPRQHMHARHTQKKIKKEDNSENIKRSKHMLDTRVAGGANQQSTDAE